MTKPTSKRAPTPPSEAPQHSSEVPDPRRLHEATDRLNDSLLTFEKALVDLKLGVSASITLEEDQSGSGWVKLLAFSKTNSGFKLVVEAGYEGPDEFEATPITSASRETRLQAVRLLPRLYDNLLRAFEREIVRVQDSVAQVEEFTRVVRAKAGQ